MIPKCTLPWHNKLIRPPFPRNPFKALSPIHSLFVTERPFCSSCSCFFHLRRDTIRSLHIGRSGRMLDHIHTALVSTHCHARSRPGSARQPQTCGEPGAIIPRLETRKWCTQGRAAKQTVAEPKYFRILSLILSSSSFSRIRLPGC